MSDWRFAAARAGGPRISVRAPGMVDDGHDDRTITRRPSRRISGALRVPCVAIDEAGGPSSAKRG